MAISKKQAGIGAGLAAALALATPLIMKWEGKRNDPYLDIVKVPTVCWGHTGGVQMDRRYSNAECEALLSSDIAKHTTPVLKCVPRLADRPYQLAAASSLAFNIGTGAFCRSTAAKRFRAGQWRAGCDAFLSWRFAGGREVRGLLNRRREERRMCLTGVPV